MLPQKKPISWIDIVGIYIARYIKTLQWKIIEEQTALVPVNGDIGR